MKKIKNRYNTDYHPLLTSFALLDNSFVIPPYGSYVDVDVSLLMINVHLESS